MQYYASAPIIAHVNMKHMGEDDEIYKKMPRIKRVKISQFLFNQIYAKQVAFDNKSLLLICLHNTDVEKITSQFY